MPVSQRQIFDFRGNCALFLCHSCIQGIGKHPVRHSFHLASLCIDLLSLQALKGSEKIFGKQRHSADVTRIDILEEHYKYRHSGKPLQAKTVQKFTRIDIEKILQV